MRSVSLLRPIVLLIRGALPAVCCLLTLVCCPLTPPASPAAAPASEDGTDEKILKEAKVPTDGPGLLEYLRKRFTSPATPEKIKALIEQLGDDDFRKREEASRLLVMIGPRAKKQLQGALSNEDLEIKMRAQRCLEQIQRDGLNNQVIASAVRVLGRRKPAGAAALLLSQLPTLGDDPLAGEVREALVALAVKDGKADPALVAGLKDSLAVKREAAAVALARAQATDQLPALRKLLEDSNRQVRLSVALALVQLKEKKAVPVLIAEMDQPLTHRFGQAEEVLFALARDKSPQLSGEDEASRKKYRETWETWWKQNADQTDLSVLAQRDRVLGHTVVVLLDDDQVIDLDATKKERWKIDGVQMVLDIQPLPGDRVLLAEYKANRVTERNSKGEIVWDHKVEEPLVAQRLANGNTFIATRREVLEVDRTGKQMFNYSPPDGSNIMRARKLPGGDILIVTQLGVAHCVRLNRFGRKIHQFGVEVGTSGGRLDVTASGNLLIPELYNNRVCEFDPTGRLIRAINVQQPIVATALPGGNVLVTSMTEKRAVEFDRSGREVWEYRRDTRVTRAVRY